MAFQTVSDARFVQVGGQRLLVRCYDPDTGDVVALWPSDVPEDPSAAGHFVASSIQKQHTRDEYVPEDDRSRGRPAGLAQSFPIAPISLTRRPEDGCLAHR